ncbi:MAG: tRNA preQ1(34) S-adenosylmethionine ribosyltransferase-isomerase QueA [Desulfarculaceae bacterium]|nr:tRNA preQ1(34) S-adenosylmethionine ribosyltransferase-isomerase QueA [Desulfarculaceae bacterium]MCF8046333.1 tRNA preQ1(34) S-adenosylmethionine ribosyltransferase-isomerase QueA [Desulfarculaceae bacterium]MCF8063703.1 tRNA preQ1(34) S-adenosylmethionine ribosyltransferase-isomerase QueA [Desulfarculaceae bacterium]MCF8121599.1 tRNA preQ1(34) S-adenosylmethionine ribosyltransferase-isomerase QueA [Desulfarculaceae bacterium]
MAETIPHNSGPQDLLAAYDYELPPELIAQAPARRRVQARLLHLPRYQGPSGHHKVAGLTRLLRPGDLLVLNDTRVVPARLMAAKPTGGRVEILLLSPAQPQKRLEDGREVHQCLLRSHKTIAAGARLRLGGEPEVWVRVLERGERGRALVEFPAPALGLAADRGATPLPPYIKRPQGPDARDASRYQTVYASQPGAVAAPTAGLHLSRELLSALARRGVEHTSLTLHVGYGTFAEPDPAQLASGRLHSEWVEISPEAALAVARAKKRGGRVIAVGTTSLRSLEWRPGPGGVPQPGAGWCDLLIAPGHSFRVADGLITNFHLPRTTLLMLVAALAGRERILDAYRQAMERSYRFYSYGDAMLII